MKKINGILKIRRTLQFRLFLLIVSFSFSIFLVILIVLFSTQSLDLKSKNLSSSLENDFSHVESKIKYDMDYYSIKSRKLAEDLETKIENYFDKKSINVSELPNSGDEIENILFELYDTLNLNLELSTASGTFVVLNSSVNYNASTDDRYRAGMCLSSIASGNSSLINGDIRYLIGPTDVARSNGITILPQWELEFDITNGSFYETPHDMYDETNDKDFYWSEKIIIPDSSDEFIFCSVPMSSSDNFFLGCAGFMINSNLFKYSYSVSNDEINDLFLCLSPYNSDKIDIIEGMSAGNYSVLANIPEDLTYIKKYNGFDEYGCNEKRYLAIADDFELYNDTSVYKDVYKWKLILSTDKSNIESIIQEQNMILIITIIPILMAFIASSYLLSKKYLKPVKRALNIIKTDGDYDKDKTNILEIDDLMEFLAEKDRHKEIVIPNSNISTSKRFGDFLKDINTLSKAERAVFDLYAAGHTAKEIEKILFLSANTIKTHNKRIYMKLGVSSYKELMVYLQIMRENNYISYK